MVGRGRGGAVEAVVAVGARGWGRFDFVSTPGRCEYLPDRVELWEADAGRESWGGERWVSDRGNSGRGERRPIDRRERKGGG